MVSYLEISHLYIIKFSSFKQQINRKNKSIKINKHIKNQIPSTVLAYTFIFMCVLVSTNYTYLYNNIMQ